MASRAPARASAQKAVIPAVLSNDDLRALLGQTGEVAQGGGDFHRMTLKGGILQTDDGEMFPPRKDGPSLVVRIVSPPVYYNAFFLSEDEKDGGFDARRLGRGDLNGRFSRKYDDPAAQARDNNEANALYDQIENETGKRGNFKADMVVQIAPASGEFTGDETEYTLSLSTTSIFEWRGTSRDPFGGSVTDSNFITRLGTLARDNAAAAGLDEAGQKKAILDALTALRMAGIIAEVSILPQENDEHTRNWWVLSFNPIVIAPFEDAPALEAGPTASSGDDVPF